jgi:hypothetical protein
MRLQQGESIRIGCHFHFRCAHPRLTISFISLIVSFGPRFRQTANEIGNRAILRSRLHNEPAIRQLVSLNFLPRTNPQMFEKVPFQRNLALGVTVSSPSAVPRVGSGL